MTDPISDFLTRLRNASKARLDECILPHSNLKESVAGILKTEGYIVDFSNGVDPQGHKTLVVKMKFVDGTSAITGLTRVSTPGRGPVPRSRRGWYAATRGAAAASWQRKTASTT